MIFLKGKKKKKTLLDCNMISSLSNLLPIKIFNKLVPPHNWVTRNFLHLFPKPSGSSCQGVLILVMQNDSSRGSVKSTASSSDSCWFLLFEVKRINLSIDSAETVSASSLLFPICGVSAKEHRLDSLLDGAGLISSASIGPDKCSEHRVDHLLDEAALFSTWL